MIISLILKYDDIYEPRSSEWIFFVIDRLLIDENLVTYPPTNHHHS